MSAMADKNVQVSTEIARDAHLLYGMVSELCDMGKWSPEATGGRWVGGSAGPAVGARFRGNNRAGWRRWSTTAKVTEADPGKRFAFRITFASVPIAAWSYEFAESGSKTVVTESWTDLRARWMELGSGPIMGVPDRPAHARQSMEATLAALKSGAEAK
jgi:hypothetical protein